MTTTTTTNTLQEQRSKHSPFHCPIDPEHFSLIQHLLSCCLAGLEPLVQHSSFAAERHVWSGGSSSPNPAHNLEHFSPSHHKPYRSMSTSSFYFHLVLEAYRRKGICRFSSHVGVLGLYVWLDFEVLNNTASAGPMSLTNISRMTNSD